MIKVKWVKTLITKVKNIVKTVLKVRKILNVLFLTALLYVACFEIIFRNAPEIIPYGEVIGQLASKICLAFITSYIFFFVNIHLKTLSDKEKILGFVRRKVESIIGDCDYVLQELVKSSSYKVESKEYSSEDVSNIMSNIPANVDPPLFMGDINTRATWLEFLCLRKKRSAKYIGQIFSVIPYIDSALVSILNDISDCTYFTWLDEAIGINWGPTFNLRMEGKFFYTYMKHIDRLREYNEKNLKEYTLNER